MGLCVFLPHSVDGVVIAVESRWPVFDHLRRRLVPGFRVSNTHVAASRHV